MCIAHRLGTFSQRAEQSTRAASPCRIRLALCRGVCSAHRLDTCSREAERSTRVLPAQLEHGLLYIAVYAVTFAWKKNSQKAGRSTRVVQAHLE